MDGVFQAFKAFTSRESNRLKEASLHHSRLYPKNWPVLYNTCRKKVILQNFKFLQAKFITFMSKLNLTL